jgi:hypothetical protein
MRSFTSVARREVVGGRTANKRYQDMSMFYRAPQSAIHPKQGLRAAIQKATTERHGKDVFHQVCMVLPAQNSSSKSHNKHSIHECRFICPSSHYSHANEYVEMIVQQRVVLLSRPDEKMSITFVMRCSSVLSYSFLGILCATLAHYKK